MGEWFRHIYGKSGLNVSRIECMQEIVCGCAVSNWLLDLDVIPADIACGGRNLKYHLIFTLQGKPGGGEPSFLHEVTI